MHAYKAHSKPTVRHTAIIIPNPGAMVLPWITSYANLDLSIFGNLEVRDTLLLQLLRLSGRLLACRLSHPPITGNWLNSM